MPTDTDDTDVVSGQVKWFDSTKGYGFVVAQDITRDILLHANVLRNFGQNSISDGSRLTFRVVETERGMQAQEILEIEAPDPADIDEGEGHGCFDPSLQGGELEPARVKWFDRSKGFGFANVFGLRDDVFIHVEVLRRSSLADLGPGEAIAIRVAEGVRGRLATQVQTWEAATAEAHETDPVRLVSVDGGDQLAESREPGIEQNEAAE